MSARSPTTGPGFAPFRMPTTPVLPTPGLGIQTQTLKVLCDNSGRALLLVSKFRMLVNVATPIDQLLFDGRRAFANLRFQ